MKTIELPDNWDIAIVQSHPGDRAEVYVETERGEHWCNQYLNATLKRRDSYSLNAQDVISKTGDMEAAGMKIVWINN